MKNYPYNFFELFRIIVDNSGLSQREIARRTAVNFVTVNRIYVGIELPRASTLRLLAQIGLGKNEAQCAFLEQLRSELDGVHTTSHRTPIAQRPNRITETLGVEERALAMQVIEGLSAVPEQPKRKRQFRKPLLENA